MSIGLVCANGMGPFAQRRRSQECVVSGLIRNAPLRGDAKKVALSQGLRPWPDVGAPGHLVVGAWLLLCDQFGKQRECFTFETLATR